MKNSLDFFDRLDKFMKHRGLNDNQITVKTGISNGLIGKARKNRGSLSQENIAKILLAYPELSADWLLTGRGCMLCQDILQASPENVIESVAKIDLMKDLLREKEEENVQLRKQIWELESNFKGREEGKESFEYRSATGNVHT